MILADTSAWAAHLRQADPRMDQLLRSRRIVVHPFVIGELAVGNLPDRPRFLDRLSLMNSVPKAADDEVMRLIERGPHFGSGLGWIDMHLLASVLLTPAGKLLTLDKRLNAAAQRYGRAAQLHH